MVYTGLELHLYMLCSCININMVVDNGRCVLAKPFINTGSLFDFFFAKCLKRSERANSSWE